MKVSDELKEAWEKHRQITEAGYAIGFAKTVADAIPRIIALERCRELLANYHIGQDGALLHCTYCRVSKLYHDKRSLKHSPDCEIAKALEATP